MIAALILCAIGAVAGIVALVAAFLAGNDSEMSDVGGEMSATLAVFGVGILGCSILTALALTIVKVWVGY